MNKIALIPSYEPDEKLLRLLKEISSEKIEIILINDGSGEKYNKIFEDAKEYAYVISYKENKGKGYALKKGLRYIKDNFEGEYIVITMDSDGQHTIEDAKKIVNYLENNRDCLVLGKRVREKNIPLRSRLGNEITRIVFKIITGVHIYDTQTGLRVFSNKFVDMMLKIPGNRYEYEMNVLLEFAKQKRKIKEIEIQTIYFLNNNSSHFNVLRDSLQIYRQIIKYYKERKKKGESKVFSRNK